jgi:hypothetical protein
MIRTTQQLFAAAAIATASLLSAGSSFAQEATPDTWLQPAVSTKRQAQVAADLATARQTGLTEAWSDGYIESQRGNLLRAEVKARTAQALASGEADAINARVYNFSPVGAARMSQASL